MNDASYLENLNPEQKAAVTHTGSPLLILAGAGSGKTRVITAKIAYLISEQNVRPSSILAVTFTKKAAREMQERAMRFDERAARSQIRTFHSFGSWFLRSYADEAGIDRNFTVYDDDDMVTLITKAAPAIAKKQAAVYAHKIALAKDYCLLPDDPDLVKIESDSEFPKVYQAYQERLRQTGNVDFGDLIMLPVLLLKDNPAIAASIHSRFKVVMVDEYQDTNVAQFMLLQQLAGPDTYICVVGDDDQSIYSFRGAEVQNILTFEKHFEGTQIIRLEKNYRSVEPVLDVSNAVIANNRNRLGKTLESVRGEGKKPKLVFLANQDEECTFVAELVEMSHKKGCPYSDWAVLYRTNAQSLGFETEFLHRKIPYSVVGSLKFYEREEIKDILAYLAFAVNPKDEIAFRRIVNKPARGIGGVTQDKIVDFAREQAKDALIPIASLLEAARSMSGLSKKAKEGLKDFIALIDGSRQSLDAGDEKDDNTPVEELAALADGISSEDSGNSSENIADGVTSADKSSAAGSVKLSKFIEDLIKKTGLSDYYEAQDEISGTQRLANLEELCNSAATYPANTAGLLEFLDHIELDRTLEDPNAEEDPDAVTLITVHNTKGLEFPRVVITGMEHGVFPRTDKVDDELEEERRLFYVGITRAKDELYLTSCATRRMYGRTEYMTPSPFLGEVTPESVNVLGTQPAAYKRMIRSAAAGESPAMPVDPLAARWKKGRSVYHDDYGSGVIVATGTTDDNEYVITVRFETGGTKRFLPKYQANRLMLEM
ncbi:MAG: UvrD-helicase domain-containing protein [Treponemataceae bacterium]|nr:UvrD-helicase domain-containing protein [Treponemataceae bacterium]